MSHTDCDRTAAILGDAAVELGAQLQEARADNELLRAELADVREILELVETERDEYRGAITSHRAAIYAPHRTGNTADRTLWSVLR